jgi:hypothetical protein
MKRIKALAAEHEARLIERVGPQKWETLIDILKDFDPTPPRSSENDDPARRSVRVAARDRD